MKGIRIINPGILSTIQDAGRTGYREMGLPLSGAMDIRSMELSNWLVRNNRTEAVIETTLHGLEIEFLSPSVFAICGADMSAELNSRSINNCRSYRARRGTILKLARPLKGFRSYIAFSGGFRIDKQLRSLSTFSGAKLGGYRGRKLQKGDILPLYPAPAYMKRIRKAAPALLRDFKEEIVLRVVPGVDHMLFSEEAIRIFESSEYTISSRSDRMGLRLEGHALARSDKTEILSYGIHPGTVQVPGDGKPIIMGADCQTTGGYPQIANIISVDMPVLGQAKPGDKVRFCFVNYSEALELLKEDNKRMDNLFGNKKTS